MLGTKRLAAGRWAMTIAAVFCLQAAGDNHLDNAEQLLAHSRYTEALGELRAATSVESKAARWHLLSSKAYDGLNRPKEAVAEAQAAIAIDPQKAAYALQLGQIFLSRNTPRAALEIFDNALKTFPDSLLLLAGRGLARMNVADYGPAEQDFAECLQRKPDFGMAFESLETIYLRTSREEEAQRTAALFKTANPADYRGFYYWAAAEDRLGRSDSKPEADAIAQALTLKPDYTPAKVLLATLESRTGDTAKALRTLEEATRGGTDYAPAHVELAKLYRKLGRQADAARELRVLQQLSDNRPAGLRYHRGNEPRGNETPDQK